jgi:hypothetical protein
VVGFTKSGERLVGQVAKRQAITNPENTVFSIKRFMGRRFDEVSEEMKMVPYKVVRGDNNDVRVDISGKKYSPPEISAMILGKLKEAAEAYLGEKVTEAVSPFRRISTTPSARPPRTPARSPASKSCASSTSRPRPPWPTGSTSRRTAPSRYMTSAAARSTSRSSR